MTPHELFDQAGFLATPEARTASDADLRRAVSACYYAVFHQITGDAAEQLGRNGTATLKTVVRRSINHAQLNHICQVFNRPIARIPDPLQAALGGPLEPELIFLVRMFPELQAARHLADYDDQVVFDVSEVLYWITRAQHAHGGWLTVRHTPNAAVFLTAVLLGDKLGKRG